MRHPLVAATGLVLLVTAVGATAAEASALPPKTSFTVQTSFVSDTSPILAATGPWSGCTETVDLGGTANQVAPSKVQFSGEKRVVCDGGDVVIHYDAVLNFNSKAGQTSGSWSVVSSTYPAVIGGAGTVSGESRGCDQCIVDTFTGRVY